MRFNQSLKMPNVKWRRLVCVCLLLLLGLGLIENFVGFDLVPTVKGHPESDTWQVGASADDCIRRLSDDYFSLVYLLNWAGGSATHYQYGSGMRFTNIAILQGSTIESANLKFYVNEPSGEGTNSTIRGETTDSALEFSTKEDFDNRPRTSAFVNWDDIPIWGLGTWSTSPDIKTIIQEIVNREGWSSGNDLVLFWDDFENRSSERHLGESWDANADWAPKLEVTWSSDSENPTYTTISTNTTRAGRPCLFRVLWWDDVGLSGFIFGTNNTGSWQNETWSDPWSGTPIAGYADVEKVLNSTAEIVIQWQVWANDTSNQWNSTAIQSLTTTGPNRFVDPNCGTSLTGTLNFTYLSKAVNGTGTLFTEEVYQSGVGCPVWLFIRPDGPTPASWYQVSLVTNNTHLTLKRYFLNDTLTTTAKVNKNEGLTPEASACHIAQVLEFRTPEAPTTIYLRRNTTHCRYTQDHAISVVGNGTEGSPITLMGDDGTGWAGETGLPKPIFNYSDSFTIKQKQYWVFKDFEFVEGYESCGPWHVWGSDNITFEDVDFHDNQRARLSVAVRESSDIVFQHCTFHNDTGGGSQDIKVYGPVQNLTFQDCKFDSGFGEDTDRAIIIFDEPSIFYVRDTTFGTTSQYKYYDIRGSGTYDIMGIVYVYNVTFTKGVNEKIDVRDWLEIPPTYSNLGTNTTLAGDPAKFHVFWQHEDGLSGYIFGTNNTGTWQNETWTDPWSGEPTSGWSNVTKTLNSTVGVTVEFQFWCNSSNNVWGTTGTKFLTTTSGEISIEVDEISVSTLRINVDTEVSVHFHSRYNNNQSSCTTGNLYVNTTEYSINSTGWASLSISSEIVTKKIYTVTGANVSGETDYQQIPPDPEIIWDRLEVFGNDVSLDRADVGSSVTYWWKLRYDYDSVVFDVTKGSVDIGGGYASWNSTEERWQRSVTLPSTPQNYSQTITFTDSTYGLTAITGTTSQSVIADKLSVAFSASNTSLQIGKSVTISWTIQRQYDNSSVDDFTIDVSRDGLLWKEGLTNSSITDSRSTSGTHTYDVHVSSVLDQTYGLTSFDSTGVSVTWSSPIVPGTTKYMLTVIVIDSNGTKVVGASVLIRNVVGTVIASDKTDDYGEATFNLVTATYLVEASKDLLSGSRYVDLTENMKKGIILEEPTVREKPPSEHAVDRFVEEIGSRVSAVPGWIWIDLFAVALAVLGVFSLWYGSEEESGFAIGAGAVLLSIAFVAFIGFNFIV